MKMPVNIIPRPFWRMPTLWEDEEESPVSSWASTSGVSVSEDEKKVFITAQLPGVAEDAIDITFDKGTLWIKGESDDQEQDKDRKYYRKATSSFSYRVAVPGDLDLNVEPAATYKNGVMTVSFTKSPHSQPKKISIKSTK